MSKFIFISLIISFSSLSSYCQSTQKLDEQSFFKYIDSIRINNLGKKIKPFEGNLLNGNKFSEKQLLGKITLINFWFATCPPCIAEFPDLNLLAYRLKDNKNFQMLGVTFESADAVNKIISKHKLTYPILLTTHEECSALSFRMGYPVTIITNSLGNIIDIFIGGKITQNEIKEQFDLEIIPKIEEALSLDKCLTF